MSELKDVIVEAIQDKKAKDIVSLDLSGIDGAVCTTFIICSADSTTRVSAIADGIEEKVLEQLDEKVYRSEGRDNSFWVVLDYSDVVVHIFLDEHRRFYALDELWSDAPATRYESFE